MTFEEYCSEQNRLLSLINQAVRKAIKSGIKTEYEVYQVPEVNQISKQIKQLQIEFFGKDEIC